jgi:phosphoglycerol transferase
VTVSTVSPSSAEERHPPEPPPAIAWRTEALWCLGTMAGAMLVAVFVLRLWKADLHVPLGGSQGDTVFNMMIVKDAITSGWIQVNDQLGAPFGQHLLDFPVLSGDNLQYLLIKALGFGSDDVAAVTNVYFLLTFALTAGTAYAVFRGLGVSRAATAVCAILFSALPYHYFRNESHLLLSGYESVPLGAFLVMSVLLGRDRLRRRDGVGGLRGWLSTTTLVTLASCVVIGSASVYYATFTVVLLVLVTPLAALAARTWRRMIEGIALIALVVGVMAVNLAPNLIYGFVHGPNPLTAKRSPAESEIYSLNLAQLVLPINSHRLEPLAALKLRYGGTTPIPSESTASLGAVGTVGLLTGILFLLACALAGRLPRGRWRIAHAAGAVGLLGLLVGTTGGVSSLIAYLLTPQVRGWNRISVFIAFFSLIVVAVLLDSLRERLAPRRRGAWLAGVALGAVAVVGVLDQTSPSMVPQYDAARADWANDGRFVKAIEQRLPGKAMIYQLPYAAFPENPPVVAMLDYDQARGYLHTDRLKFSYAAMKGRPDDWSTALAGTPTRYMLESVAAAGFQGLWIDRYGYADRAQKLESELKPLLDGQRPLVSENGRLAFYDLRGFASAFRADVGSDNVDALGRATLHPVIVTYGDGFYDSESQGGTSWRWMASSADIGLENRFDAREVTAVIHVLPTARPAKLTIRWPDGSVQDVRTGRAVTTVRRTLRLQPGASTVKLETDSPGPARRAAGDQRDLRLQVGDPVIITDAAAAPALSQSQPR